MSELFVLSNLKLIGLIQKYQRISTVCQPELQTYSLFTTITRFFFSENREKSLTFLIETLHDSEGYIKNLIIKSKDIYSDEYLKEIILDYKKSQIGIDNLCLTYKSDFLFVCKLRCLMRKSNKFLIEDIPEDLIIDDNEINI